MTIGDLFDIIGQYDYRTEVACTYEGVIVPFDIYKAANGQVLIDCDDSHYKLRHQKVKCVVCGGQAVHAPFNKQPVCYKHWETFKS